MPDAWDELNKVSREYNRNPTAKNKKKLNKAEKDYNNWKSANNG